MPELRLTTCDWVPLTPRGQVRDTLMPADPRGRSDVTAWEFAALDSTEMAHFAAAD